MGPSLQISRDIHAEKYRGVGESFEDCINRVAGTLSDNDIHRRALKDILGSQRFLPAGRVQAAVGAPRATTPYNCFVSGTIPDSMDGIMDRAKEAANTMRMGGGIGYDFSTLRPKHAYIKSLDSKSSGPISFMEVYDSVCSTIRSAGHRRGAQMGVLRIDHPDIEEFVRAKQNTNKLTNFNVSVGVTDEFMDALMKDETFELRFEGRGYKSVRAKYLWDEVMRSTWDWAEPGVLFIDTMNKKNNLWYCETIAATNPCGEQPLPPYGACLLGSFNLVKYVDRETRKFNFTLFMADIDNVVRAMDNVVNNATYPLIQQADEARSKRRMGLGVTGMANALEYIIGKPSYGSFEYLAMSEAILSVLSQRAYMASSRLAKEKGSFPMFDKERYLQSKYIARLPTYVKEHIAEHGIRNSHLTSIAPTGTISLTADNVSSGIEPVYSFVADRKVYKESGDQVTYEDVTDYAYREWNFKGKQTDEVKPLEHVDVLNTVSYWVDSACSKTCNVGGSTTWEEFKEIYLEAYEGGASGCTTFRAAGKRMGILTAKPVSPEEITEEGSACYFDPETGTRTCE